MGGRKAPPNGVYSRWCMVQEGSPFPSQGHRLAPEFRRWTCGHLTPRPSDTSENWVTAVPCACLCQPMLLLTLLLPRLIKCMPSRSL